MSNSQTAALQVPLSMEFSRQEYWSRLPFPSPGDLPKPETKLVSLMSNLHWQAGSLPLMPPGKPNTPSYPYYIKTNTFAHDNQNQSSQIT